MMNKHWQVLDKRQIYSCHWFELIEYDVIRPDGTNGVFRIIHKPHGVMIIPYEEETDSIWLINEYRFPIGAYTLKVPGGEALTDRQLSAETELYNETGFKAENFELIGEFQPDSGIERANISVFLATKLSSQDPSHQLGQGDELINGLQKYSMLEVKKMTGDGSITCGLTLSSLAIFFNCIKS